MRKKFSERYGHVSPRDSFQIDNIDDGLKNRIWNQIQIYYFDKIKLNSSSIHGLGYEILSIYDRKFFEKIYDGFFKSHEKTSTKINTLNRDIKEKYFNFSWYQIYDFIEYISETYHDNRINNSFKNKINEVLKSEMSGYRFIDNCIAPIIDKIEIKEIEDAINNSKYSGGATHLSNALKHLSNKESPDYINSIKESISAVESILNKINGTTNVALNKAINNTQFDIGSNFKKGMINIYSWTSSDDGIRHGVTGDEIISAFAEAKYMIVSCSAFINYLIEKHET